MAWGVRLCRCPEDANRRGAKMVTAQFVYWRDNGSRVVAIDEMHGADLIVDSLGRDLPSRLDVGDFVEICDDAYTRRIADDNPRGPPRALPERRHRRPGQCRHTR